MGAEREQRADNAHDSRVGRQFPFQGSTQIFWGKSYSEYKPNDTVIAKAKPEANTRQWAAVSTMRRLRAVR